jgi:hypothetical protein
MLPIGRGYTNTDSALIKNNAVWTAFNSMRWIAPTIEDTGVSIVKLLFDNLLQDDTSKAQKTLDPRTITSSRKGELVGGTKGTGRPGREKPRGGLSPPNPSNLMLEITANASPPYGNRLRRRTGNICNEFARSDRRRVCFASFSNLNVLLCAISSRWIYTQTQTVVD